MSSILKVTLPYHGYGPAAVDVTWTTRHVPGDDTPAERTVRFLREPNMVSDGTIMSEEQWEALSGAEGALFRSTPSPTLGWTNTHEREESSFLATIWHIIYDQMGNDGTLDEYLTDDIPEQRKTQVMYARVANRMARALAVMTWGAEWLIR